MRSYFILWILVIFSLFSISGCINPEGKTECQYSIAKEAKRRLVFTGATGDQTLAQQERANIPLLMRTMKSGGGCY